MQFGIREEIYNKIKRIVEKYEYKFYIFGSRARGDFKENSDIDIAVEGDIDEKNQYMILNDFDEIDMEYMIDIVFTRKINNKELLNNIKREGVEIK